MDGLAESSTLTVAFEDGTLVVELEDVDDRTCDCCNPVPTSLATISWSPIAISTLSTAR